MWHTHPAFAMPVMILPPIIRCIVVAEPEMQEPTMPNAQPPTMNHFLPRRSLRDPKIGPKVRVSRKLPFAIHEANEESPTVITWNLMTVLVVLTKTAQQFDSDRAMMAAHVCQPTE